MSHPAASASSWTIDPAVAVPAAAAAALYLGGWALLSRRMPERFGAAQATAFLGGIAAMVVALCPRIESLGRDSLQAHMIQHLLLMLVAPPLIWLGAPVAPLLRGLPRPARRVAAAWLATRPVRWLARALADPRIAWLGFALAFWVWHLPAPYELALRSDAWHHVEHASFFLTALVFWRPVILAWPARRAWPRWAMIVYLLLAEAQNTLLSAILTFADRVIYPSYAGAGRLPGVGALEDQALAGMIMWVPGSLAFLAPVLWLLMTMLAHPAGDDERWLGRPGPPMLAAPVAGDGQGARGRGGSPAR
jgi:cytochrome c oxidase assembly factor CtaG